MLQFNTPKGLFTIREKNYSHDGRTKALWSFMREEGLLTGKMYHTLRYHLVEDFIALLESQDITFAPLFALFEMKEEGYTEARKPSEENTSCTCHMYGWLPVM